MVQVGAGHGLYVPLGNLHDGRYLPLPPHLIELIGDYRTRHVHPGNPLLLPTETASTTHARRGPG